MTRLRGGLGEAATTSWDDVEETLIAGDVGAALAMDVVEKARLRRHPDGTEAAVREQLGALLVPRDRRLGAASGGRGRPAVILVVGVNGTGKTTTIGKLATRYAGEGRSVHPRRRRHVPGRGHRPAPDLGRPRRRAGRRARAGRRSRAPSSTTRWTRPSPAAPTWSSPIPRAASTRRRT